VVALEEAGEGVLEEHSWIDQSLQEIDSVWKQIQVVGPDSRRLLL
jgi:hypothetical protein